MRKRSRSPRWRPRCRRARSRDHFWSPSYLAASAGGAPLTVIKEYIESQKCPG
ncbi:transposase [Streptomyces mirabilis]|uniref:transposase n=1 Tax=Streptomyces TaxID=1883 RepID=UPI0029B33C72|nr:transposase [Streptomyces sp. AK02-04a]